ncbi:pyrophosphate--fructose 6-phosphate 1-phosphotransferase subunit alpha-like [Aristolochia californica]|uniref:pyrophosphate--fructose 6-phosphate 1-phosphotransferase subunit alpha-like n=1 Tax=Aristolochia californica TaxID=171875 RepID=UPI0035D6AE68
MPLPLPGRLLSPFGRSTVHLPKYSPLLDTVQIFQAICRFFGYPARGSLYSTFICAYAYVLGHIYYHLFAAGLSRYIATVPNRPHPIHGWRCGAAPLTAMVTVKQWSRGPPATSIGTPVVHPTAVDVTSKAYALLRPTATNLLMAVVSRHSGLLPIRARG